MRSTECLTIILLVNVSTIATDNDLVSLLGSKSTPAGDSRRCGDMP